MNRPSDPTGNRSTSPRAGRPHRILILAALVLALALAVGLGATLTTSASNLFGVNAPLGQTATTNPDGVVTPIVPVGVGTFTAPQAEPSGVSNPPTAVATVGTNTDTTGGAGQPGTVIKPAPAASSGFPWLAIIILVVIVVLGLLGFYLMRSRRTLAPAMVATGAAPRSPASTVSTSGTPTTAIPTVAPIMAAAAPFAPPATLTCPNCGSSNDWNENFCHECGQDLRPVRAAVIAASAPPADVVTDDMPYLETLDRAGEQLEYVLSRKRVVIGTTAGCDVMVDNSFKDSGTVSPRHAQLLRNDDGSFAITDLGSPTGVAINDVRVAANTQVPLTNGDTIKVGSVRFIYRVPLLGS